MTPTARLVTIGVYGFDGESFVRRLRQADVRLLLDLRQRRGVRGPAHAWANAVRLQESLAAAAIAYLHVPGLAPTTELRQLQYRDDDRRGVGKRTRVTLAPEFAERYTGEILDPFDLARLVPELPVDGATALLCVEQHPASCHRSLVAARLHEAHGLAVTDLGPDDAEPDDLTRPGRDDAPPGRREGHLPGVISWS